MVFEEEYNIDEEDIGVYIIRAKFDHVIDLLINNKTYDVDEIPTELLKYTDTRNELYKIRNEIYLMRKTISDFEKGIVVPIPKKKGTQKYIFLNSVLLYFQMIIANKLLALLHNNSRCIIFCMHKYIRVQYICIYKFITIL